MNLQRARQHWKERRQPETEWLQQMTVFESVAELERLYLDQKTRLDADDEVFFLSPTCWGWEREAGTFTFSPRPVGGAPC